MSDRHCFALYFANLNDQWAAKELKIVDPELCHRVVHILRLLPGEQLLLFGAQVSVTGSVSQISAKQFVLRDLSWQKHEPAQPHITMAIGVLKRDNFSDALYSCAEVGVNVIQPIIFEKSSTQPLNYERLQRVLIAACEQSKNFDLPVIKEPVRLTDFFKTLDPAASYIYCDPFGKNIWDIFSVVHASAPSKLVTIVGPEGGVTEGEQELLRAHSQIKWARLTPTILRATQSVAVIGGMARSIFR